MLLAKNFSEYKTFSIKELFAFTLAEVLIVLIVIGIVASLTIPTLINNINDTHYKVAWKKVYADINQATLMLLQDSGGNLNGYFQNADDVIIKYSKYMKFIKICSADNEFTNECWFDNDNLASYYLNKDQITDWGGEATGILGNGVLISSYTSMPPPRLIVDINGFQKPNTVGKDIFYIRIMNNRIIPMGINDGFENSCNPSGSGISCSAEYLK